LFVGHRTKPLRDVEVLPEHAHRVDAADQGGDRQAQGVADRFLRRDSPGLHRSGVAAKTLHPDGGDPAAVQFRQHALLEAAEGRIEAVERQLARVPRVVVRQHLEVQAGILVSGEPDEPDLALLPCAIEGLDRAARREVPRRLVVEDHLVDLPEIQVIGLQAAQRLFQLFHGRARVAPVHAGLRHQKDLVAAAGEGLAHPCFAHALVVVPGVVHERDAAVDSGMDEPSRLPLRFRQPQMPAAQCQDRNRDSGAPERARGHFNR
jgi:hypothetical protein